MKHFMKTLSCSNSRSNKKRSFPRALANKMKKNHFILFLSTLLSCSIALTSCNKKTVLDRFSPSKEASDATIVTNYFQFNGYTTFWENVCQKSVSYGNLFRMTTPDIETSIHLAKADVAEALSIPGMLLQEGFINELTRNDRGYILLENPSLENLNDEIRRNDLLVFADTTSTSGKELLIKAKQLFKKDNIGYQSNAEDYSSLYAFTLKNRNRSLYVVVSTSKEPLILFQALLENTLEIISKYDLKRGWFGAQTCIKTVSCSPGTPIEVIGRGLNEGNSWFIFDGYMEFLARKEIEDWCLESELPIVADVGYPPIYNCSDYDDLQVQIITAPQEWIDYAKNKNGYIFRQVYDNEADNYTYDGYYANPGNAREINNEEMPFVIQTGDLLSGATTHMILFNKKGDTFDKTKLWDAIMERRAVAVTEGGFMMGPKNYRSALQLLFLDRDFLEEYFGDRINLDVKTQGNKVLLTVTNTYTHSIKGHLEVNLPEQLSIKEESNLKLDLAAGRSKEFVFNVIPTAEAMNRRNVIAFTCYWGDYSSKSTVAQFELPPAISVHKLLYGTSSNIKFPVTIHNFTEQDSLTIKVIAAKMHEISDPILEVEKNVRIIPGNYSDVIFDLQLEAGDYLITTLAMGVTETTQLGVEDSRTLGNVQLNVVDLNGDSIPEYVMENEKVKVTLLTTGARVIEYIVKEKNDNVLFKLWPEKPEDDKRPYRYRGFYPYGGFEDFLGEPSIETHKIYHASVEKEKGEYVQVRMSADFYGNLIEKTFTLYGNSPLLEVRFALKMINPELNILGPQPIYEVGKVHGPEDIFIVPEMDGQKEYRMRTDDYYGMKLDLIEGWNASYDTRENISFVVAYPVSQPIFLHMWMNHPRNRSARFYYAEFQPWVPLYTRTTSYFSFYMWADAGNWKNGLEELKNRNLITVKQ